MSFFMAMSDVSVPLREPRRPDHRQYSAALRIGKVPASSQSRRLDTSRAKAEFGLEAATDFRDGLRRTVRWCEQNADWAR